MTDEAIKMAETRARDMATDGRTMDEIRELISEWYGLAWGEATRIAKAAVA